MFLLEVLQFLGLLGLLVQTFVAWVFVALFVTMERQDSSRESFRHFLRAFVALAVALTVMSARFLRTHDVTETSDLMSDGQIIPTICYSIYLALKVEFGLGIAVGSHLLVGAKVPRWLSKVRLPALVLFAGVPFFVAEIGHLLVIQAPVMIACAILSLRGLRSHRERSSGIRFIRISMVALAGCWVLHAAAIFAEGRWGSEYWLPLNSFIDLGVQLLLGVGLVVSVFEIAQRKQLEAEEEREQLRHAMARDDKLTALGGVVSGVAHELNNPLTVILGYAELLRDDPTGDGATVIVEQAQRCRGIVRSLSALAGQSVQRRTEQHAEELLQRVVRGLPPKLTTRGRRVEIDCPPDLKLICDGFGIEQVFGNLVVNALHVAPPDSAVWIRVRHRDDQLEFRVEDDGPGIPEDVRNQLFDPFFTTKEPGEGTGLGLSIAHAIVRQHGGTIDVEDRPVGGTEPPRGAVLRVTLPRSTTVSGAVGRPRAERVGNHRLLVVDDDRAVREVTCQLARRRGWDAESAGSAEEALERDWDDVDAVLCDLRMPGMGGAGLHDQLSTDEPAHLERVIFFTGDLASPAAVEFSDRCTRPLLEKPIDYDELFATLSDVAQLSRPPRPEASTP